MKKSYLLVGSLIFCLSLTACSKENINPEETITPNPTQLESSIEPTILPTKIPTPEPTEIPKVSLEESATLNLWDITITNFRLVDNIQTSNYTIFKPEEGNKYIRVYTSITNKNNESKVFLPMVSYNNDVVVKLLHGTDEYVSCKLVEYEKDLHDVSIEANSTITNKEIAFEIPTTIAESNDELLLSFTSNDETVIFKLR